MATHFKSLDQAHLLTIGSEGFWWDRGGGVVWWATCSSHHPPPTHTHTHTHTHTQTKTHKRPRGERDSMRAGNPGMPESDWGQKTGQARCFCDCVFV